MQGHRILGSLILAAVLGAGATAHAAEDDALSDTARELFVKGVKAYEQQKWDQCRAALLAAFAVKRHSQIAGNLAECELKLGKDRDAAEHAWFAAHALRADATPEKKAAADGLLKEALKKVGALAIKADVDGASVLVDGQVAGKVPLDAPIFVEPGSHVIEALHPGDAGVRVTVDAGAGETRDVILELRKAKGGPPLLPPAVEKRPLWPAIAAGSVAVVAFAVGGALTAVAGAKRADAATLRTTLATTPDACAIPPLPGAATTCQALQNDIAGHDAFNKAALGTFIAGGALAVVGAGLVGWAATGPRADKTSKPSVRIAPLAGQGQAGAVIVGIW